MSLDEFDCLLYKISTVIVITMKEVSEQMHSFVALIESG